MPPITHLIVCVLLSITLHSTTSAPLDAGTSASPSPNVAYNTEATLTDATTAAPPPTEAPPTPATTPIDLSTPGVIADVNVGNTPTKSIQELTDKFIPEKLGHYVRIIPRHFVHVPHLPVAHVHAPPPPPILLPSLNHYLANNPFGQYQPRVFVRIPKGGHYWNPMRMRSKLYEMDPGVGNYLEKMLPTFRNQENPNTVLDTVAKQKELVVIKTQPNSWQWGDGQSSGKLQMPNKR